MRGNWVGKTSTDTKMRIISCRAKTSGIRRRIMIRPPQAITFMPLEATWPQVWFPAGHCRARQSMEGFLPPANVSLSGGLSPYGTMGQSGNAFEWTESSLDGSNDVNNESRVIRGGAFVSFSELSLRSSTRGSNVPAGGSSNVGFRVASVPEPSTALLLLMAIGAFALKRRIRTAV